MKLLSHGMGDSRHPHSQAKLTEQHLAGHTPVPSLPCPAGSGALCVFRPLPRQEEMSLDPSGLFML